MRKYFAMFTFLLAMCGSSSTFATTRCNVSAEGFSVEKSRSSFDLLYRGALVYSLTDGALKNATYGGKSPDLSCDLVRSTNDMVVWILGWRKDLLISFGIIRENGQVKGVQRLIWFPHDGPFSPLEIKPNHEIFVKYGNYKDLNTRICWNSASNFRWTLSNNQRVATPEPCEPNAMPYGPRQRRINIESPFYERKL